MIISHNEQLIFRHPMVQEARLNFVPSSRVFAQLACPVLNHHFGPDVDRRKRLRRRFLGVNGAPDADPVVARSSRSGFGTGCSRAVFLRALRQDVACGARGLQAHIFPLPSLCHSVTRGKNKPGQDLPFGDGETECPVLGDSGTSRKDVISAIPPGDAANLCSRAWSRYQVHGAALAS